jgi:hypothetical protein
MKFLSLKGAGPQCRFNFSTRPGADQLSKKESLWAIFLIKKIKKL